MRGAGRLPLHGWLGLGLVATFWPLDWLLEGLRTHWCFFPLWLGYCLAVDGLNVRRSGTSLLLRDPAGYVGLFLLSVPLWWVFEALNLRTQNWQYLGREAFGDVEYALLSSLSFSTVVPAVLGTAEWAAGLGFVRRFERGPTAGGGRRTPALLFALGFSTLALLLAWPRWFFPCVWLSLWFLAESINLWAGRRSLFEWTRAGDWRPLLALALGTLVCGFFWEMWNVLSYPKWIYHVPLVGFWPVFEMPLLGYLGYVPFSFEVFAFTQLVLGRRRGEFVARGLAGAAAA